MPTAPWPAVNASAVPIVSATTSSSRSGHHSATSRQRFIARTTTTWKGESGTAAGVSRCGTPRRAAIAQRLGVPHLRIPDAVPGTPVQAIPVVRRARWRETALWWPERDLLVVAEAIGTADAFTAGHGAVGMHPILRARPPRALRGYCPEHLLCGHGPPVHGAAARDGVEWAYAHARSDIPRLLLSLPRVARA